MADPWAVVSQKPAAPTADPWKVVKSSPAANAQQGGDSFVGKLWHGILHGLGTIRGEEDVIGAKINLGMEQERLKERQNNPEEFAFHQRLLRETQAGHVPKADRDRSIREGIKQATPIALGFSGGPIGEGTAFGAVRRALEPSAAEGRLADFQKSGVSPTLPAVGQGRSASLAAKLGRALPASPIAAGMRRNLAQTATAADRIASRYGAAETPEAAGNITRNALNRFASDASQAKTDYAKLDALMHGAPPAPMTATRQVLADISRRFPHAQSYVTSLEEKLRPKTQQIPQQVSPILGPSGQPIVTSPAHALQSGGALHWKDIKTLRTDIGYRLDHPTFGPSDVPHGEMRRLYAAVTRDMQGAARQRGPAALKALQRATINYGTRMRVIERLEPLVAPNSGDGVFARINQAAQREGSASADVPLLETAKKVMGKDWGNVGAAMIRRMGVPTPGAARFAGEPEFSIGSFATNWNRLSARAKNAIFGDDLPRSNRAALESLARVANAQRNVLHLAGQSPTGEANAMLAAAGAVIDGILRGGHSPEMMAAAGTIGTSYGLAKVLMSPKFTSWWTKLPRNLHEGMAPQKAAQLLLRSVAADSSGDEAPRKPPQPPAPKIGDRGPAGGTITGKGADAL